MARSIQLLKGKCGFNAETKPEWTYRVIVKHVLALEQDSPKLLDAGRAARAGGQ